MKITVWGVFFTMMFLCVTPLGAQKWGDVDPEDLTMTGISEDPEADAVVLFDIGEMIVTKDFDLFFKRHRRIKILTEQGKERGDVTIRYWHRDKMKKFKAHTILPNGKKVKVKGDNTFEEEDGIWKKKVVAFPGVETGSIIEMEYTLFSEYLTFLEPWKFQNDDYTKLSRLTVYLPDGLKYRAFFQGPLEYRSRPEQETLRQVGPPTRLTHKYTWNIEDIPGLDPEPFMGTIDDYRTTLYFQLVEFRNRYSHYSFIKSWDDLANELGDDFRHLLVQDKGLRDLVSEKVAPEAPPQERAEILFEYVRDEIRTETSGASIYSLAEPHEVVENMKGTRIEKNILLINLLRHADLEAYPVMISRRSNGAFHENWAQLLQFDHIIACLETGSGRLFLDAGEKQCPYGLLPVNDLNEKGLLVDDGSGSGEIVAIPYPPNPSKRAVKTVASLNEEGDIHCEMTIEFDGYHGIDKRREIEEEGEEEFVRSMILSRFGDAEIDTFEVSGLLSTDELLAVAVEFDLPAHAQVAGERMYLTPPIFEGWDSNPFPDEQRVFPVEYEYATTSREEIELSLPDGYVVSEIPDAVTCRRPGLEFASCCLPSEGKLGHVRTYFRRKRVFEPVEYENLRDFCTAVTGADQLSVVLER